MARSRRGRLAGRVVTGAGAHRRRRVGVALVLSLRTAATDSFWAPLHTSAVVVAAAAAGAAAAAVPDWRGVPLAGCGLAAACAAALMTIAACVPVRTSRPARGAVQVVAGGGRRHAALLLAPRRR